MHCFLRGFPLALQHEDMQLSSFVTVNWCDWLLSERIIIILQVIELSLDAALYRNVTRNSNNN